DGRGHGLRGQRQLGGAVLAGVGFRRLVVVDVVALLAAVAGEDALALRAEDEEDLLAGEDLLLEAELAEAALDADLGQVGLELEHALEVLGGEEAERDGQLSEVRTLFFGHRLGTVYPMGCGRPSINLDGGSNPEDGGNRYGVFETAGRPGCPAGRSEER